MTVPQTGFEASNGEDWTTLAQEAQFYADVKAASGRMGFSQVGESVDENALWLATVGAGDTGILFVGLQHATEPAGREAMLMLLRDLALTEDATLSAYLGDHTVAFVPTVNPDSFVAEDNLNGDASTRQNSNGVDLNRDHLLSWGEPEAAALAAVLRDHDPTVIIDGHEQVSLTAHNLQLDWGRNLNVHPDLYDLGVELVNDVIRPAVEAAEHTTGTFGWATNLFGNPITLNASAGLRHAIGVLFETRRRADDAQDRIDIHRLGCDAVIDWHRTNHESIGAAVAASKAHHAANSSPIYLDGADNVAPSVTLDPASTGYGLTGAQHDAVGLHRDRFGISSAPEGDGHLVPLTQEARAVAAYLLDEDSTTVDGATLPITAGVRVDFHAVRRVSAGAWVPGTIKGVRDGAWEPVTPRRVSGGVWA